MDIAPIAAPTPAGISDGLLFAPTATQRPLQANLSVTARAETPGVASSVDSARSMNPAEGRGKMIDRLRTEFEVMRHRLVDPGVQSAFSQLKPQTSPAAQLEAVMNQSMRIQTGIFQAAVSFQAGLTASQQVQSGIKTLVEKA